MEFKFREYGEYEGPQSEIKFNGYDFWSLDYTLAHVIGPSLKKFREECVSASVPYALSLSKEETAESEQKYVTSNNPTDTWGNVLDAMIKAFDLIIYDCSTLDKVQTSDIEEGLRLFALYYRALWT